MVYWSGKLLRQLKGYGIIGSAVILKKYIVRVAFSIFLRVPSMRRRVEKETSGALDELELKMVPREGLVYYGSIPAQGLGREDIRNELATLSNMSHAEWESGKVSGAIYHGGEDLMDLLSEAYSKFSISNPLHPDVFPAIRKMEAEVVSMVLRLYNAPDGAGGTTTSGGTESILMACKAYREKGKAEKGIREPEMVVPRTIHAAFEKASHYFKIKIHFADIDPVTGQVNLKQIKRLINSNTIMIAGSAPNFPHGIMDDIPALSEIACSYRIPLHVDACLGSFLVPYLEAAGFPFIPFDFSLPGVTSISCDTHKYGFAPKGSSVIMYRSTDLRQFQYFVSTEWPGGVYASPSIAGSRPGALIAGCWVAMMNLGHNGYLQSCVEIVGAAQKIKTGIKTQFKDELHVIGDPLVSVVSFKSDHYNIYMIGDEMSKRGWHLNGLQDPPALHIAVTRLSVNATDSFLSDLRDSVDSIKAQGAQAVGGNMTALYGAGALPGISSDPGTFSKLTSLDKSVVSSLAVGFLDTLYKT